MYSDNPPPGMPPSPPPPPSMPGGPPPLPAAPNPPPPLQTAVYLMYLGAVLAGVGFILNLVMKDEIRDSIRDADSKLSESELDTAVTFGIVIAGVVAVFGIALWLTMAYFNRAGRSWARIVATVLFGLNTVALICAFATQNNPGAANVLGGIGWLNAAVITVLLWLPASSAYYRAVANPWSGQQV